jgi:hypothetical protein
VQESALKKKTMSLNVPGISACDRERKGVLNDFCFRSLWTLYDQIPTTLSGHCSPSTDLRIYDFKGSYMSGGQKYLRTYSCITSVLPHANYFSGAGIKPPLRLWDHSSILT